MRAVTLAFAIALAAAGASAQHDHASEVAASPPEIQAEDL